MSDVASNNLLQSLRAGDRAHLEPHLATEVFEAGHVLYEPGDHVQTVYFPCDGAVAGYYVQLPDGKGVETAMVGREGAVGGIVSQGRLPSFARCSVQARGPFLTLRSEILDELKNKHPAIEHLFARYADCLMAQVFQSTACNAGHSINQRAAKWIIATIERSGDTVIRLSQDQLAEMLGIGRSYICRVIAGLKRDRIIAVRWKQLEVLDLARMEAMACDCNEQVKDHFNRVLRGVYPDAADNGPN
jgi:CRP-like cAMP-binding protein